MQYWYNIATGTVEENNSPDRDRAENLMGPYATREEAQAALTRAAERTEAWDAEDERRHEEDEAWGQTPAQVLGFDDGDDERDDAPDTPGRV